MLELEKISLEIILEQSMDSLTQEGAAENARSDTNEQ